MKNAASIVTLACLVAVSSTQAKWSRVPVMQEKPVNLVLGGTASPISIDTSTGIGQVDNLLGSDVVGAATLAAGKSFFVISLGKPVMVSTSSFSNDGIEGRIVLSASADKAGWATLEEKVVSAADRIIDFKFAGIQAKFLKYEFLLSKGGSIRALSVMGGATDRGFALKQDPKGEKGQPMNFVGGLGGARLIYAAPSPVNGIDSAATFNKFEFPESDEQYRTLIYDFGQVRILNEFSSVHSPSPVRFEVFTFEKLPEKEDWRGRLSFNPADFNLKQPVASGEDRAGTGSVKMKPASPVKTRYIAMRWEPDFNPPAFAIVSTGMVGNVSAVQGASTSTVVINGETVTVTVDPGPAIGAGTTEAQATVTITTSSGSVTYSGAGVTGVNLTGGTIQIVTGNSPDSSPSASQPAVATVTVGQGGTLQAAPTAVGFILGAAVAPTTSGSASASSTPPASAASGAADPAAVAVVASVLGVTPEAATTAITQVSAAFSAGGGGAPAAQTAVSVAQTTGGTGGGAAPIAGGSGTTTTTTTTEGGGSGNLGGSGAPGDGGALSTGGGGSNGNTTTTATVTSP